MPHFTYEVVDKQGQKVVGSAEAKDREALLISLRSQELVLLRWLSEDHGFNPFSRRRSRILKGKALLSFTKDFGNLLKSGLPLDRALSVIVSSAPEKTVVTTAKYLKESLREGKSLSDAMASRPSEFNDLYVNMVRVGEMGGVLAEVMEKLAEFQKRTEETRSFIISSSIYPSILLSVGIISVFVIMGFVVPRFATIFSDLGQEIPLSTKILILLSSLLKQYWWLIPLTGTVAFLFLRRFAKSPFGKAKLDGLLLHSPIFGNLIRDIQVSRFARTLGTLVLSGVPFLKALSVVKEVVGNHLIREAVERIYDKVSAGKRVSNLMKEEEIFPPMAVQMAAVGEETGRIGEMLVGVSDELDTKVQARIRSYLALLEPMAILFMGLIIGIIVVSMLTAIFGINEIQF